MIENVKVDMSYSLFIKTVAYCSSSLSCTARTYITEYERTTVTNDFTYHFYHT